MPFVNVKIIEGVFSDGQKQDIVRKLTDAMVTIEGENMRQVTWVVVEEVKSGDWGIGGQSLTTSDVKALAAGAGAPLRSGFRAGRRRGQLCSASIRIANLEAE